VTIFFVLLLQFMYGVVTVTGPYLLSYRGDVQKHQHGNSAAGVLLVQEKIARGTTTSRRSHSLGGKNHSAAEILDIVQEALACQSHADCSLALNQIFQKAATPAAAAPSDNHTTTTATSPSSPKQHTTLLPQNPTTTRTKITAAARPDKKVDRGILLTSQCSGSDWLANSLDETPGIQWTTEPLMNVSFLHPSQWNSLTWNDYVRDLEQGFPVAGNTTRMVGLKLMYDQIPSQLYEPFAKWVSDNHVYVLHLRRRCAAMQLASQMEKVQRYERLRRTNIDVNHFSNQSVFAALPPVQKLVLHEVEWQNQVKILEDNQKYFARYLRANMAARAPVFEISYEDLDGPHQANWLRSVQAFLGFVVVVPTDEHPDKAAAARTFKTGSRLCETRIDGLGGPGYLSLNNRESRVECMMLRASSSVHWLEQLSNDTRQQKEIMETIRALTFPRYSSSSKGPCQWTLSCKQLEYLLDHNLFISNKESSKDDVREAKSAGKR